VNDAAARPASRRSRPRPRRVPPPVRRPARPGPPPANAAQAGGTGPPGAAGAETAHEAAARIAASLPPLTEQQRDRLALLLGGVRPGTPRPGQYDAAA